jgi:hypothetical protein
MTAYYSLWRHGLALPPIQSTGLNSGKENPEKPSPVAANGLPAVPPARRN